MPKAKLVSANSALSDQTIGKWRSALAKRSKGELIEFILHSASVNQSVRQAVQSNYDLAVSNSELITDTRHAIEVATDFDERDANSNFDYDIDAYRVVESNFARLISIGECAEVMELAVKLMQDGSRQIECSDEGMMTHEIEACLRAVIKALEKAIAPASAIVVWCEQMLRSDRVGFICNEELHALREKFSQGC